MYRLVLLLINAFIALGASAQEAHARWSLFTNVFQNIDVGHPRLNVGIERLTPQDYCRVSAGRFVYNFSYRERANGWSINGVLGRPVNTSGIWVEFEAGYAALDYSTKGLYSDPVQPDSLRIEEVVDLDIFKRRLDLSVMLSWRLRVGERLWFSPFMGLGLRYKWVSTRGQPEDREEVPPTDLLLVSLRDQDGDRAAPLIRLGVLIGFTTCRCWK